MSEFEYLGNELREQLHALVADVTPSTRLMAQVDGIPSAGRPRILRALDRLRPRRVALAIPLPIAGIAAAAVFVFGGATSTSFATAVTVLPNGEVRINLAQLGHVAQANAILRRHHIHNIVVVPMTASCRDRNWSYSAGVARPSPTDQFTPRTIAPGYVVVVAAKEVGPDEVEDAVARFRGPRPTCASTHGWGMGMGNYRHYAPPKGQQG